MSEQYTEERCVWCGEELEIHHTDYATRQSLDQDDMIIKKVKEDEIMPDYYCSSACFVSDCTFDDSQTIFKDFVKGDKQ